ncbi:MAG: hypothetical protein M3259_09230 [Actinomycetota bacterium]|nr:hypothetical protein [Actinomycetota bacterium]
MAERTEQLPTYTLGDKIRIELEVTDESGVGEIEATFSNEQETGKRISFAGNGEGETSTMVVLEREVVEGMAPGLYQCFYVSLIDNLGNKRVTRPHDMRFRIEGIPGDHEGPRLHGYRVIAPEGIPSGEVFGEATIGEPPIQRPQEEA